MNILSGLKFFFAEDLSLNKQSYQSATDCPNCGPSNAVDRQTSTCIQTEVIGKTSEQKKTWWYVDLGGTRNLFGIRIQFKDYGPSYGQY